jgi:hypothetical protein
MSKPVTLHYEINIRASAEKLYLTMLDEKHYREWTAEFNPTSHYEGSWSKGAKIRFQHRIHRQHYPLQRSPSLRRHASYT